MNAPANNDQIGRICCFASYKMLFDLGEKLVTNCLHNDSCTVIDINNSHLFFLFVFFTLVW